MGMAPSPSMDDIDDLTVITVTAVGWHVDTYHIMEESVLQFSFFSCI